MNVVFKTFMLALLFYSTFVQISVFSLSLKITDEELDKAKQTEHPSTQGPSTSTHEEHTPLREPLTHRMVATTGPSSPRVKEYVTKIRKDKASKTKGVAVSGILKDSKSNFYYPKITTTAGKERSYVLNLFHGKSSAPLSEPNMHMKYPQSDHPSDQGKKASFYQIGHIKIRKSNRETIEKINEHMRNMRHDVFSPKAAMIHYTRANPEAAQKLPTVQVDAGKYHGNLISLVFGESSPRGKRKSPEPVHHSTNDHLQTDGTIDMLSRVGKTPQKTNSPDSKGKKRRIE